MKLSVHPLTFIFAIISIILGYGFYFAVYITTALLHECGHIFYAQGIGYKCDSISIAPYGATTIYRLKGISVKDEVYLCLCGPLVNVFLCIIVVASWWFFPITYAYTEVILTANIIMLIINLLPVSPLDGGRILRLILESIFSKKAAYICRLTLSVLCIVGLILCFIFALNNISLLIFALFILVSLFEKEREFSLVEFTQIKSLQNGMEIKYVMCAEGITYRRAMRFLDRRKYLILQIERGDMLDEVTQDELFERLKTKGLYDIIE